MSIDLEKLGLILLVLVPAVGVIATLLALITHNTKMLPAVGSALRVIALCYLIAVLNRVQKICRDP